MKWTLVGAAALSLFAVACGKETPTTPTAQSPAAVTTMFTGTLAPGGSRLSTFSLTQAGTAAVTLIALTSAQGQTATAAVTLALGTPNGSACTPTTTVTATPALKAHASPSLQAGTYCVTIGDSGALDGPLSFVVRIVSYPVTTTGDPTALATIITNLPVGGYAARTFTISKGGTINVTLTSLSPSASVGLGVGVAAADSPCALSTFLRTEPGTSPQISVAADAGEYCVKLIDLGDLAALTRGVVPFTMTIAHP